MPIYNYSCVSCNHDFDRFLSISNRDNPITEPCPNCSKLEVTKSLNRMNMFQFEKNLKPDDTFKDILKQIAKNNKHSTIDENFGS